MPRTRFRRLRRLRRISPISKMIFAVLVTALSLYLLVLILSSGTVLFKSFGDTLSRKVFSAESGSIIKSALFSEFTLLSRDSAPKKDLDVIFELAPDDGFSGLFSGNDELPVIAAPPVSDPPAVVHPLDGEVEDLPAAVDIDPTIRTITIAPSSPGGYDYGSSVYIKNETSHSIDVDSYLNAKPVIDFAEDKPVVLIVHTHTSEAYYPDDEYSYVPTDVERTEDKNYNMVRIGDSLSALIEARGYSTLHIRDIFDYPSYPGSYTRTLAAIEKAIAENPSIRIVIDVHRDAMVAASGDVYRTVAEIDGEKAAQIMLVVGTNEGGLRHPEWKKNLTFAIHLQKQIADDYPLLMRPINLRKERFNQHATNRSLLVEMGTSGNTLGEALYSTELFAKSLCDLMDSLR